MEIRAHLANCTKIIREVTPGHHRGTARAGVQANAEVSYTSSPNLYWGLKVLQQHLAEILSAYDMPRVRDRKHGNDDRVLSEKLRALFGNAALYQEYLEAVVQTLEAETFHFSGVIETYRRTEAGSKFVATTPIHQTPAHIPPASSYDEAKQAKIGEVIGECEIGEVDEGMFYFSFGVELKNLHSETIWYEAQRVLGGSTGKLYDDVLHFSRISVGLQVLLAHLKEELSRA